MNAAGFLTLILGVVWIVMGLILADTILSNAATSGADANIGSFSGARSINDLVPFIYYIVVVIGGLGMIGVGAGVATGVVGRRRR